MLASIGRYEVYYSSNYVDFPTNNYSLEVGEIIMGRKFSHVLLEADGRSADQIRIILAVRCQLQGLLHCLPLKQYCTRIRQAQP